MLIGELARRTGTTARVLRHYERAGLLRARRRHNGYRDYDDDTETQVVRIRALLAAGLPIRIICQVLPCTLEDGSLRPCPGVLETLRGRLAELDRHTAELTATRKILRHTIEVIEERT